MVTYTDRKIDRPTLLSIFLAALLVTAGCSGVQPNAETASNTTSTTLPPTQEDGNPGNRSDTVNATDTGNTTDTVNTTDTGNATDLRNVTLPDSGSTTVSGELDRTDPVTNGTFYEPIAVTVDAWTRVNITIQTNGGEPQLRIRNPNATITQRTSGDGPGTTEFTRTMFAQTGRYTIEATSATPNATFEYNLTIERTADSLFAGPKSTWSETEKYLEFGRDFVGAANATADNGQFSAVVNRRSLWANADDDYLIIGYQWDAENLTGVEMNELDTAILLTYTNSWEIYRNATDTSKYAEGRSWVPDVIYFRAENPQGELYRTNFLTLDWAIDYAETGNESIYAGRYYATNRLAPGNPAYDKVSDDVTTTPAEFPRETYRDFTHGPNLTHAEKYYAESSNESDES